MKGHSWRRIVGCLIVVVGLLALNYPLLAGLANDLFAYRERQGFETELANTDEAELERQLATARAYNAALAAGEDLKVYDDFALLKPGARLGYLEVPRIAVDLAVRYSTSDEVLKSAVGVVEASSLPVGGVSTHSVISGHTGLASRRILTDLPKMEIGDLFFLHILGQDLAYQTDQILVVEPWETEELAIVPGKDYVTLLTCTPYGVNDHRLLVRGVRVDYDFAVEEAPAAVRSYSRVEIMRFAVAGVSVLILIILAVILARTGRKQNRKKAGR